jgi:hypothetical protein
VTGTDQPNSDGWYEFRLQGHLDPRWSAWFDGMQLVRHDDGTTVVRGPVLDQAALHGVLARLRDLGVPLLSVTRTESDRPEQQTTHHDTSNGD